uniref:Uncharacterized protein n=2 Tax=Cacopsylla melanoneura TaxID=428564 RepID=A0A8D8QNH8_9HEMI
MIESIVSSEISSFSMISFSYLPPPPCCFMFFTLCLGHIFLILLLELGTLLVSHSFLFFFLFFSGKILISSLVLFALLVLSLPRDILPLVLSFLFLFCSCLILVNFSLSLCRPF